MDRRHLGVPATRLQAEKNENIYRAVFIMKLVTNY